MTGSLYDAGGNRKYLNSAERLAFVQAALTEKPDISSFCLTLAFTGARISEALALTSSRIDASNSTIVFETLKQRRSGVYRAVPIPTILIFALSEIQPATNSRLWPWGRTTGWKILKSVMKDAGIADRLAQPKALRHGFAVEAGQNGVSLNIVQRWLGHARIETTAIYAGAIGPEERRLASMSWSSIIDHL